MKTEKKIKGWLIASLLKQTFSGQPDNVLRPIKNIIDENESDIFPYRKIVDHFEKHIRTKSITFSNDDIEHMLDYKYGNNETISTLILLYPSFDFNFEVDHIYPKSKFTKKYLRESGVAEHMLDYYMDSVNNICNLQLLPAVTNNEKQDKDFDKWFDKENKTDGKKHQYREIHCLPDMEYSYPKFKEFMEKRRGILRDKLKEKLKDVLES